MAATTQNQRSFGEVVRRYAPLTFVTLFFNAVIAIGMASYSGITDDWSLNRGWRNFSGLFGGLGGMLITSVVFIIVVAVMAWIVTGKAKPWIRVTAGVALLIPVALLGQPFLANIAWGKFAAMAFFLLIVAIEVLAEDWVVRLFSFKKKQQRTAPVTNSSNTSTHSSTSNTPAPSIPTAPAKASA